MILKTTVTSLEGCLQFVAFTSVHTIVLLCLARPRRSRALPIMGTEHRLKGNEHWLFGSKILETRELIQTRRLRLSYKGTGSELRLVTWKAGSQCKPSGFLASPVPGYRSDHRVSANSLPGQ